MNRLRVRSLGWFVLGFAMAFALGFAVDHLFSTPAAAAGEDLSARVAALEKRMNGIKLVWGDQINGSPWGCGGEEIKQPPYVMVGEKDGTGCSVTNLNYYRKLELVIPE